MYNPPSPFDANVNFCSDFGEFGDSFAAAFDFDINFGANLNEFGVFFGDIEYDDVSFASYVSDSGSRQKQRHRRHPNQLFHIESVKNSCWYKGFTAPGDGGIMGAHP
jgi:hypothetical protein